jgi:hypothetical protein
VPVLDDAFVADVFGIEMADVAAATNSTGLRRKSTPAKVATTAPRSAPTVRKTKATTKTIAAQKPMVAKVPAKPFAGAGKSVASRAKG